MSYDEPEGTSWGDKTIMKKTVESAKVINEDYLGKKLKGKKYREVFIAMGKEYAAALPDLSQYGVNIVFPAGGGPDLKLKHSKNGLIQDKFLRCSVSTCPFTKRRYLKSLTAQLLLLYICSVQESLSKCESQKLV